MLSNFLLSTMKLKLTCWAFRKTKTKKDKAVFLTQMKVNLNKRTRVDVGDVKARAGVRRRDG